LANPNELKFRHGSGGGGVQKKMKRVVKTGNPIKRLRMGGPQGKKN